METPRRPPNRIDEHGERQVAPTWESLVDRQIREAVEEGRFDDLPHRGERLPLEDDSAAGDRAMAYRVLRNAGAAPPWIEADKEARTLLARRDAILARATGASPSGMARLRADLERAVIEVNTAIGCLNAEAPTDRQHRRPLVLAEELARLEAASRGGSTSMTDATARGAVFVREATPADADGIREVAVAAWRATYATLIPPDAIERFLAQGYTPERVALRIERHEVLVATGDGPGSTAVEAFAECVVAEDHVQLVALYARPDLRGRGLGTALLERVVARLGAADLAADVLVGNVLGEPFYVARGFEPGDELVEEIAGVPIRERRWWLRPTRARVPPDR